MGCRYKAQAELLEEFGAAVASFATVENAVLTVVSRIAPTTIARKRSAATVGPVVKDVRTRCGALGIEEAVGS
jgi:hypothetical protein